VAQLVAVVPPGQGMEERMVGSEARGVNVAGKGALRAMVGAMVPAEAVPPGDGGVNMAVLVVLEEETTGVGAVATVA
jgi:hypothetical protein